MMRCVIISGGAVGDYDLLRRNCGDADLIICADSGITHLDRIGIVPDIWVGDFDSARGDYSARHRITLPREKDDTDTMYAARIAVEEGAKHVTLLAASGTRLDHTIANLFVLKFLEDNGVRAVLNDEHNSVFIVTDNATVARTDGTFLSILPFCCTARGVSISGVKYPLDGAVLYDNFTLGISNEIIADFAQITVKNGALAVFMSKD